MNVRAVRNFHTNSTHVSRAWFKRKDILFHHVFHPFRFYAWETVATVTCSLTLSDALPFTLLTGDFMQSSKTILLSFPLFSCLSFSHAEQLCSLISSPLCPVATCNTTCTTSCCLPSIMPLPSSSQLSHRPQALTPHFMDHSPPAYLHALLCVCMCICMSDEKWETAKCNSICGHLECRASTLFSLKACEWHTGESTWGPAAPRAHKCTLFFPKPALMPLFNASELRSKPLWCLFYRVVKCWQLTVMETNRDPATDASPGVIDGCFKTLRG